MEAASLFFELYWRIAGRGCGSD